MTAVWAVSSLRTTSAINLVGKGKNAVAISNSRLSTISRWLAEARRGKIAWWAIQTPPIVRKLVAYARYAGHWWAIPRHRWSNSDAGTCTSRINNVIAIANTPSLNASMRFVDQ